MPELPEVETIVRGLRKLVTGKEITEIISHRSGTISEERSETGEYGRITGIRRRGKYLLIDTDIQITIMIHLRMTGKLIFDKTEAGSQHLRAEIRFSDKTLLIFDDVRTFGKIIVMDSGKDVEHLSFLGPEPLETDFNEHYLSEKIKGRKAPVKNILLDQRIVAGLGNIYVVEILHRAGISPEREGGLLTRKEINLIIEKTREVLQEAISCNGTTISDYRSVDDKSGEFQNFLRVYGKEKCKCGAEIKKIKQAGRTSYFCPNCQK